MLAEELPAFLDGVVRIAALGRSLGVHLVLATQRPAGVVSADIAANVNLRIALRVRDQVDSEDVIEARDAAAISPSTPGRALARSAANPLVLFQTARVGRLVERRPGPRSVRTLTVDRLRRLAGACTGLRGITRPSGATDLRRHRPTATRAAAVGSRCRQSPAPGCRHCRTSSRSTTSLTPQPAGGCPTRSWTGRTARPKRRWRGTSREDGHLLRRHVLRSGRSTCLRTLAGSLAARFGPDRCTCTGSTAGPGPCSGADRAAAHRRRRRAPTTCPAACRLLDRLRPRWRSGGSLCGRGGFGALAEQHAHVARGGPAALPGAAARRLGEPGRRVGAGRARPPDRDAASQLMRDGAGVGLRVVLTGDRGVADVPARRARSSDKVVLRLADPADLLLAGVPVGGGPPAPAAGRGLRLADHAEVQVARWCPRPVGPPRSPRSGPSAALRTRDSARTPAQRPLRIEPLPDAGRRRGPSDRRDARDAAGLGPGRGSAGTTPARRSGPRRVDGPRRGPAAQRPLDGARDDGPLARRPRRRAVVAVTCGPSPLGDAPRPRPG